MALKDIAINIKATGVDTATGEMRKVRSATQQMADGLERAQSRMMGLGVGVVGIASMEQLAQRAIEASLAMERIESAMGATFGKGQATAREMQYVREEATRLGLEFNSTAQSYIKFAASTRNSSIEGEMTRRVFSSVAEAVTAMQLPAEQAEGIFLALSQMMSKGKVSAEELTGQLGERLPGATKLAADAMGMTTAELLKQMQAGEILASDLLPRLAEKLHETYGKAAEEAAQKGQAGINRFKNEILETESAIGSKLLPKINELANSTAGYLKDEREGNGPLSIIARYFENDLDRIKILYGDYKTILGEIGQRSPLGAGGGADTAFWRGVAAQGRDMSRAARADLQADYFMRQRQVFPNIDPQMSRAEADQRAAQDALNKNRKATEQSVARQAQAEKEIEQATRMANQQYQQYSSTIDGFNKQIRDSNPYLSEMEKKLLDVDAAVAKAIEQTPQYRKSLLEAGEALKTNIKLGYQHSEAMAASKKLMEETAVPDGREKYQKEIDDGLTSAYKQIEALKLERSDLKLTSKELAVQVELRKLSTHATVQQREEVAALTSQLYDEQQAMSRWKQIVERIDQTFHDGFVDMLERGKSAWSAFARSLAMTFKALVADAIYAQFARPIVLSVVASGAGALGIPGLASAATSANSPISMGLTGPLGAGSVAFSNVAAGAQMAMSQGVVSGFSEGMSLIGAGGATNIAGGIGMMLPGLAAAAGVAYATNAYFGNGGMWNQSTKDQKWMRGASLATFMAPALLDWATGGGLFGTKWKTTGGGVSLGVEDGEAGGYFYTDQKKKKKWFKGNQYSTTYSELDRQWEEFIDMQYDSIVNAMKNGASMMGRDGGYVDEIMQSFSSAATKINLAGLSSEDQQKAVSDYFRKITNEALLKLYPELEASIRLGEDAAAAWERMNALRKTNTALLMQELDLLGQKDSAGYMDLLNEQREMELLNMDASTQAIQRRIWALQDEKSATDKLTETSSSAVNTALSAANALRDIMGSNLSSLSPEAYYRQQQASFAEAQAAGRLADLPELGKAFLTASRAYNASGAGYMSDYDTVTSALASVAGMIDDNPTLTAVQRQVSLLEEITSLLQVGNLTAIAGFSGKLAPDSAVGQAVNTIANTVNHTLPGVSYTGVMDLFAEMQSKISNSVLPMDAPAPWSGTWQYEDGSTKKSTVNTIKFDSYEVMVQDMIDYAKKYHIAGYAKGGITSGLSFAGEAGPEAVVPLPDGRTIPVRIQGTADNYSRETVAELREQNRLLREIIANLQTGHKVAQAVGEQLVELGEETNKNTEALARGVRMAGLKGN